jgi:C-terminal processing protease CtpA/Prc
MIAQKLKGNVGYLRVPEMWSRDKNPAFFEALHEGMEDFAKSRALIIDLRHNGGGVRDVLIDLAPYFMAPDAKPWVANVARVRITEPHPEDEPVSGMSGRYLLPRGSVAYDDADRASIDEFLKGFKAKWDFDASRFSVQHFLVLKPRASDKIYHYDKPVYILTNERSFSAASVMAACLKGMGKVQIAGVRSDGSSGRSQREALPNSGMRVRLSTMISFQRNGKTLDGNGTEPDIFLPVDMKQVLGQRDSQIQILLGHIR